MTTGEAEAGDVVAAIAALGGPGVYEVTMVAFVREDGSFLYEYHWQQRQSEAPAERSSTTLLSKRKERDAPA